MIKSKTEILEDLQTRLIASTPITNVKPGSTARIFQEVLTEEFYEFYTELDLYIAMSFVSTATDGYLDLIGELLDCARTPGESDADYRARISSQVYVIAGANLTALRLKLLQLDNVLDVKFKPFTQGAGSFTVFLDLDDITLETDTLNAAQTILDNNKAFGVEGIAELPDKIFISLGIRTTFKNTSGINERDALRNGLIGVVKTYMNGLDNGSTFVLNQLERELLNYSNKIADVEVYSLQVNGEETYITNITSTDTERIYLDSVTLT